MYPVVGTPPPPFQRLPQFYNDYSKSYPRVTNMPSYYNQYPPIFYPDYQFQYQPVQKSFSTVIIINQPNYFLPMQLPTASTHSSMSPTPPAGAAPIPQHYNSYFSPASHSRPIQINAPSSARYNSYNERVMGLDFEQPSTNQNNISAIDSVYLMDFMDDENPPASSSVTTNLMRTESIEDALRRAALSTVTEDDKENGSSTKTPPSPSPRKEGFNTLSSATASSAATSTTIQANPQFMNMQILGEPGMRSFKRRSSYDDEILINEETESEAGFSGDDDCMSNCGCVHSFIGSPIDFAPDNHYYNNSTQPFTRLGFKSIGDIIGYAQVVKAERLEALAELRNAVDKFNDMRQRKYQIQNLSATKVNPTN